jgi:DNA replication protein DnaC
MFVIYGLCGIGKTELAKSIYNKVCPRCEFSCHCSREIEQNKGLEDLQKTVLLDV